ncbi:MAG: acyl-CoA dehydrogenase family protein [Pseudorhodoplanes sp.]|uniref:acyl-CoA dehydrogenase family protein n=1 Tax=Pseudorhodoplanes sp. TaxID=1934341 RepID=UPI003D12457E
MTGPDFTTRFALHPSTRAAAEAARELAPVLRSRAAEAESRRMVHAETIADMRTAGLFRLMQPESYDGTGRAFADYVVVAEELGAGCPSSAWIYANVVLKSWMIGMFPREAQDDVWGADRDTIAASILRPTGRSRPVAGGYRLTGKWSYVSGVDHTQWTIIGSLREGANGSMEPVVHLVPRQDYRIVDNWHVVGLVASGSKDIVLEDVFVPEHRTLTVAQVQSGKAPGAAIHPENPVFRVPLMSSFGIFICAPVMGIARGALACFLETIGARATMGGAAGGGAGMTSLPTIQLRLAEAQMRIDAARATMLDSAVATLHEASHGGVSDGQRIANRRAQSYSARISVEAVDIMFEAVGAAGLFLSQDLQRYWRDAHAGAAHFGINWDAIRLMCGQYAAGQEPALKYY